MALYDELAARFYEGDFNYAFNISLRHGYLYVETAKAACTTIKTVLGEWEFSDCNLGEDIPAAYLSNVHINVLGTPFIKPFQLGKSGFDELLESRRLVVFSFVRNPFSRLLSAYLDKMLRASPESFPIHDEMKRLGIDLQAGQVSFAQFLDCIGSMMRRGVVLDKHWRPQTWQMSIDLINYDYVGKVEHLNADLTPIATRLGLPQPVIDRTFGHETGATSQLHAYYDNYCKDKVLELYASDFDAFGYDRSLPIPIS